eukprot:8047527-Alexandrium_andersonii.AAC.1
MPAERPACSDICDSLDSTRNARDRCGVSFVSHRHSRSAYRQPSFEAGSSVLAPNSQIDEVSCSSSLRQQCGVAALSSGAQQQ